MVERKLSLAALELPVPENSFPVIEERAYRKRRKFVYSARKLKRLCIACVFVFILAGFSVWAATTDIHYSAWASHSNSYRDAERHAKKLGFALPEVLGECPFSNTTTLHVVSGGTTYLEALIGPVYRWYSIDYEIPETGITSHADESSLKPTQTTQAISISMGSTENALWRYCFGFNEDNIWSSDDLLSESYQVVEYNGYLLQMGTTSHEWATTGETTYSNWLHWIDETRGVCIGISADTDFDTLIEYAKRIIDLNP